jgi:hypothetical protein
VSRRTVGLLVVAVVVLGLWIGLRPKEPAPVAAKHPPSAVMSEVKHTPVRVVSTSDGGVAVHESEPDPGQLTPELQREAVARWEKSLSLYKEFARFPPWSRPADLSQQHLWVRNTPEKVAQPIALDENEVPISAELSLDRLYAGPGESITATLEVWSGNVDDPERKPVPFTAKGHVAIIHPKDGSGRAAGSVDFTAVPQQPTKKHTTFVLSRMKPLQARNEALNFTAQVTAGDRTYYFNRRLFYTAAVPFEIEGKEADAIVNGSLEVRLRARSKVKQSGQMRVQATLFDGDGKTPISVYDGVVQVPGEGPFPLVITFFGKTIRDGDVDGPYSIRALSGIMTVSEGQDIQDLRWSHAKPILTRRYAAKEFSDAEWDAPEKDQKIRLYQREIDRFKRGP